ncbi:hypothetical protein Amir_3755 [Actinosynnema mirum DSM 43827]|uniref:Uncharacterized protein n=1 Tax=Actinosynnema mirum (strain ATCC 29888 / DSM 43827 / JCM 3225 / NBRC 14064 / NCIMB 13271 / NRRL B-12336 / IMRU 3971 / 101) TaxID=446462 RepID=C6WD19_ACTMD|nr:hypothetical protein Amir_3755 [Actinosynnema mirum DSM 43827]
MWESVPMRGAAPARKVTLAWEHRSGRKMTLEWEPRSTRKVALE